MASNCLRARIGCVEKYMRDGGPVCWDDKAVREKCGGWGSADCADCKEQFCRLSPMRPSPVVIQGKEYDLCAACQKPYAVHRAHWTYDTHWAREERKRAELNHERMHEMRWAYERDRKTDQPPYDIPF